MSTAVTEQFSEMWDAILHGDVTKLESVLSGPSGSIMVRADAFRIPIRCPCAWSHAPGLAISQVNAVGAEGQMPLHLACDSADDAESTEKLVKLLYERGADVNAEDCARRTPLLAACELKALGAARYLIEHTNASLRARDDKRMTPVHWLAAHGAADLLSACLAKGAEVDAVNASQQTPLHLALMRGELVCCFVLLDANANAAALDEERRTAMHLAMQHSGGLGACSESTILLLRLLQLAPSLVNEADADKRTPLHWASGKNALPCVKALLSSGAEVDAVDWAQRTPLHWAVLVDAAESAEALLQSNADLRHADRDKRTPLHWACDRAAEGCCKLLLGHLAMGDPMIDAVDWGGYTALHYAARRGATGCVKSLLALGANRRMVSMSGELPADLTSCEITRALLEERIGMKRQRSLSSANSLVLFSLLPTLAQKFYDAWKAGENVQALLAAELRDPGSPNTTARLLREVMLREKEVAVASMHVSTETSKVVVELLTSGGSKAMHSLTFTDDGLISSFEPYMCMAQ